MTEHDPLCELVTQVNTGMRRGWVCTCTDFAAVRADERRKVTDEWTAIGIEQWNIAWAAGELKARITARKGFEDACELLGREELTLSEILTVLNGGTVPDPLFHDYDGHNSCTRCGQKAYNSGAEGPCPNHPNRNK